MKTLLTHFALIVAILQYAAGLALIVVMLKKRVYHNSGTAKQPEPDYNEWLQAELKRRKIKVA